MNLLYASVGSAIQHTSTISSPSSNKNDSFGFWMTIKIATAAAYYSFMGPESKSAEVVGSVSSSSATVATTSVSKSSSSSSSTSLIQNAWGVVSLPAVKRISLEASKILKGAAIAERISIAGVPCFILSTHPFPVLATALKRYRRQRKREFSHLSTIKELSFRITNTDTKTDATNTNTKNIIFHLTGGGFFAHTIAGDLPFLLDWSNVTHSVVICPEYALLPQYPYPVAMDQVTRLYQSLRREDDDVVSLLGFRAGKIVVTGESVGGNLATALCVKICIINQNNNNNNNNHTPLLLPDALLLCCPALNLSLDLSPSRVRGIEDPVLPTSLLTTISDTYLPNNNIQKKTDPTVSPYYAPDHILTQFPSTLIHTSYDDPLLDDSVDFNDRLHTLGVESNLRAAHHMPHAFWGLGTAGFPEAREVQLECCDWLSKKLAVS